MSSRFHTHTTKKQNQNNEYNAACDIRALFDVSLKTSRHQIDRDFVRLWCHIRQGNLVKQMSLSILYLKPGMILSNPIYTLPPSHNQAAGLHWLLSREYQGRQDNFTHYLWTCELRDCMSNKNSLDKYCC